MAQQNALNADARDRAGKGAARAARRAGRVPAVVYGGKQEPRLITLDPREIKRELEAGTFFSTIFDLKVEGDTERVIPRDLQVHPVKSHPQHVDLLRVTADTRITVDVPCHFLNEEESPGLKRGGVLNVVRFAIEVICGVDNIPQGFDFDLTGLDIGDSVHASAIALPDGVELTITDRDFTVATIAAPTVVAEEEAAEAAEGEEGEEGVEGEEGAEEGAEGAEAPAEGAEGSGDEEKKDGE
ncbi:MAG: 50S ribosomal protein L25/general stress protein Ctc [Alphaproteobacteria bacterium]|nr:50S ribosomal protein L25/general stress protein Ctc [Alphaproteobacteria bacterium]